jgi:hypothetical protein
LGEETEPGRTIAVGIIGAVVLGQHTANDILVDVDPEGMRDLLGDAQVSEPGIAPLDLDDRRDELQRWAFGAGFAAMRRGREQQGVLPFDPGLCGT